MGIIMSKEAKAMEKRNKEIEEQMMNEQTQQQNIIKLLLLGAGECGKSTILKQMKILHSAGFTEEDYQRQRLVVYSNIFQSMFALLRAMDRLGIKYEDAEREIDAKLVIKVVENEEEGGDFDAERSRALSRLWSDGGIQKCFKRRNEFQLNDSAQYFLDALDRISDPGFSPTQDDILRCRVKTTGVVEVAFVIKGMAFRVFDVGGQRSERKKWIHCFDDVNAIIFISAISEYDQVLFEDDTTNRMHESLRLFDSICNNQWFLKTSMILFLNKKDLFEEKLKISPLTIAFPEYIGTNDYEETTEFITRQFASLNQNVAKQVYSHITCATDTGQVGFVLDSTMDMIIAQNMQGCGLY